ncbi:MAG: thioredoxin family protein [Persicimonas sp.]
MGTDAIELTSENFEKRVLTDEQPFVAHFGAEWCEESTETAELLDEVAEEYDGDVEIGRVDIDENTHLANDFRIQALPTLIFFHRGHVLRRLTGEITRTELEEMFEQMDAVGRDDAA